MPSVTELFVQCDGTQSVNCYTRQITQAISIPERAKGKENRKRFGVIVMFVVVVQGMGSTIEICLEG